MQKVLRASLIINPVIEKISADLLIMKNYCYLRYSLISVVSVSTGSSTHAYTRGSVTHQLNKELDNVRNQRNKLGKYLYCVTGLIYFVLRP